jgi:hypothetical protein
LRICSTVVVIGAFGSAGFGKLSGNGPLTQNRVPLPRTAGCPGVIPRSSCGPSANFVPARGHFEEVSRQSSQAIGDTYLALAYYYSGNAERGRTMLESLSTHPSASTAMRSGAALASIEAAQGGRGAARRRLVGLLARDYRDHHVAYSLGATYAQLGEMDNAVRWLRTAADTGFPCLTWFERDPLLEPVRRRPEFAELHAYVRSRRESSLSKLE